MKSIQKNLPLILVALVAFVLGLKQIHEPDLWWMFRTGEWMVANGEIPTQDVFSYTHKGTDWISVKWLFELIAYGFAYFTGPESLSLLQAFVNVFLVVLIIKTTQTLYELLYSKKIKASHPLLLLVPLIFLFFADFRLTGRPEMFSHLFTAALIYLFTKYKLHPGKFIFWIIPIQIIWVNIHEGFAVGLVLIIGFCLGTVLDGLLTKKTNQTSLKQLLLASALAILAVAINPRGFYMFYHPYFLFSVVGSNHYTTELNSVFYRPDNFFSYKEPYFVLVLSVIGLWGSLKLFIQKKTQMFDQISLGLLGVMAAFIYLGATGYRNVIFPIIVILPLAAVFVIKYLHSFEEKKITRILPYFVYGITVVFYLSIVTNHYYLQFNKSNRYGLNIYQNSNPTGASKFIKDNNLSSKRAFSDYLTSAYFLWDLSPEFESFIDLRDLDIFPHSFFEEFARLTTFTNLFKESEQKYQYKYAVLYTQQFPELHRYLYHTPDWIPVYADNVAAVYVKDIPENQTLIHTYTLPATDLKGHFKTPFQPIASSLSNAISYSFWPGYTPSPTALDSSISASKYYRIVGDFERAEYHATLAISNESSIYEGYVELGDMYLQYIEQAKGNINKPELLKLAKDAYSSGYQFDNSKTECIIGLAKCAQYENRISYALKQYKKALKIAPDANVHVRIAQCYSILNQSNPSSKNQDHWFEHMEIAYDLAPYNQTVISRLAQAYCEMNDCEKADELLIKYNRLPNIPESMHAAIEKCKKRCLD